VTTEYLVDGNRDYAQVLEERVNDALIASYVHGLDLIGQERGNTDSYYLVDGLGSTRGLTDGAGNVTNTYSYDAFGNLIASAGNVENDYLFAGEQFDEDLEQYYLRQRYYESETGRFTRRDTYSGHISDPITLHKYTYANANPVNGVAPSGFATIADSLSIINTIGQLAARAYISVANPVVIEQARAWASILAAGIGLLGLVLTETKQDGTVGVKVVPDEWGERNKKHKPGVSNPNDGMNQMRVQVQDAPGDTLGIPIYNNSLIGVTVGHVYQAVGAIWQQRESFTNWLSRKYDTALIKGMAFVTKTARDVQKAGGTDNQGGQQVATVQWDPDDYKGVRATKSHGSMKLSDRKYYRVDFENVRGRNLRVE
jgi:RHS repeat-associated protein